jgi:lipoate-protein ligase A
MAVDEAILESVAVGTSPATLRLYDWSPACLSLGYAQDAEDVDLERLRARGWDLVRRPTGGRAILHADEITYAVIGPASDPRFAGGILDSYRRLDPPRRPRADDRIFGSAGRPGCGSNLLRESRAL